MKWLLLITIALSANSFAYVDTANIGQSNSASNGFTNAAVAGQTNTQVNMNAQASAKYGNGVECPQATLTVAPYGANTMMGGTTGQTMGVAVGVAMPLGDGGTCRKMAANLEHQQVVQSNYDRIKLCLELKKMGAHVDAQADPELYETCKHVHLNDR